MWANFVSLIYNKHLYHRCFTETWNNAQVFQCYDGSPILRSRVCDGMTDCPGVLAEDESQNCREQFLTCLDYWEAGFTTNGVYILYTGSAGRWSSAKGVFHLEFCVQY